jgi:hypothetical protein
MKKIVLSIAGVMAIAAFAPEASALPVFARQTGMACSACHFQHFPLLNGFGRSFKAGGFTMMGAQAKVEGDNLSIPAELNMAVLTSLGYVKTNQTADTTGVTKNYGNGVWGVPGAGAAGGANEASLFFGGHVSDFAGFLSELTLGGASAALGSAKLPILFPVGDSRVGVVPFATDAQGASYTMETLNTGANAVHMQSNTVGPNNEFANALSAQQYINTAGKAMGMGFVATNDMGFINITKYQQTGIANGTMSSLGSTYARLAGTFDMAGWDSAVGIQSWSGSSLTSFTPAGTNPTTGAATTAAAPGMMSQTKATAIDGQMQGDIGGLPVGFYASYARAPAAPVGLTNTYNTNMSGVAGTLTRSSFNVNAEVGVLPGIATIGAGVRQGKSGVADAAGNNLTDNAIMLTATYKLQQNMMARLSYVSQTGGFWNNANNGVAGTATNSQVIGSKTTMLNMYVLF